MAIYVIRNARATAYWSPGSRPSEEFISSVKRYHRNRIVLLDPSLASGELGPPFLATGVLFPEYEGLARELDPAGRTVLLGATTGTPLLIEPSSFNDLSDYLIFPIRSKGVPSFDNVLRHLRIAEYSQIDFLLRPPREIPEDLERDYRRRFWRILGEDFTFGGYFSLGKGDELASSIVLGIKFIPPGGR